MTALFVLLALAALALGGWGAGLVRSEPRAAGMPLARSLAAGRRRTGTLLAGGGLVLLLIVLWVRP
jgi:hypothetical protein